MIEISCKKELNGGGGKFLLEADLSFESGDFVALYGASGGGKTTILRLIAGFEAPQSGFIKVGDKIFFDEKTNLAPQKRNIGFLFQDYALFENMNVFKNLLFADSCVACGDKILGKAKDENEALAMLNLQSGNECSVYTAMIFLGEFELINVSKTTYKFKKFNEHDLNEYIKNNV